MNIVKMIWGWSWAASLWLSITNSRFFLSTAAGRFWQRATVYSSGPVEVVVGDPIDTTTYSRDNLEDLIRQTRDAIITNFNPAYPGRLNIGKETS